MSLRFSPKVWEAEVLAFLPLHLSLCQTSNRYHSAEVVYKSIHLNVNTRWHFTYSAKKKKRYWKKKMTVTFICLKMYLKILQQDKSSSRYQRLKHRTNVRFIIKLELSSRLKWLLESARATISEMHEHTVPAAYTACIHLL